MIRKILNNCEINLYKDVLLYVFNLFKEVEMFLILCIVDFKFDGFINLLNKNELFLPHKYNHLNLQLWKNV